MACAGADVVTLAKRYANRVDIVHAKDIRKDMTDKLLPGEITCPEGVKAGMFAPIGQGDMDFKAIVAALTEANFDGYYVLVQDIMIDGEPAPGEGSINNAKASLEALMALAKN